jgi:DNA-binding response OmpR family regulator
MRGIFMAKEKILIVDDEESVRKLIKKSLIHENYLIEEASSGQSALAILQDNAFDLIILDVMLGDQDGFELIKEIKSLDIMTPIILVSGRSEDYDKILGLGLGASNYITKPFSPAILCAHVKAQIRSYKEYYKPQPVPSSFIIEGPFKFDLKTYRFYKNECLIDLSYKENQLIKFFIENPHQVFTKQQLYENIWSETIIDDNAIMVYMHNLRKKIEDCPKSPKHITTVWGIGYKFVP